MAIDQLALIDLLTNLRNQSPPTISPAAGGGANPLAGILGGTAAPQAAPDPMEALRQRAFAPETPELLPEEPKMPWAQKLALAMLGAGSDALGARANAYGGNLPINMSQQLMERIRQGRYAREENKRRTQESKQKADRAQAQYELAGAKEAERRQYEAGIREEDRAFDLYRESGRIGAQEDKEARARQFERETIGRSETLSRELAKLRADTEIKQEAMRQSNKDDIDKVAVRQEAQAERESTTQGIQYVVGTANTLAEKLAQPGVSAEGVRKQAKRALDALGVRGKAREEVWKYWIEEVEPDLQAWEQKNAPVQGPSPEPSGAGIGRALQSPSSQAPWRL